MDEFLKRLAGTLDIDALREFGVIEREMLKQSMARCNMTDYPPLVGQTVGERASGDQICEVCGNDYFTHPADWRFIGYGNVSFLNVLCDGRRVKL